MSTLSLHSYMHTHGCIYSHMLTHRCIYTYVTYIRIHIQYIQIKRKNKQGTVLTSKPPKVCLPNILKQLFIFCHCVASMFPNLRHEVIGSLSMIQCLQLTVIVGHIYVLLCINRGVFAMAEFSKYLIT